MVSLRAGERGCATVERESAMSQTLLFILGGCTLGAIQLAAGIVLGMWLRRHESPNEGSNRQAVAQAQVIAKRLHDLADEMFMSVGEHRSKLDQASQLLTVDKGAGDGKIAELVVDVVGDIVRANQDLQSKLETAEARLDEQAAELEAQVSRSLTDPLTGLPNRREFGERLEERMGAWNRRQEVFSLLLLDVDHFKKLNDQHGHMAGDQVLAAIGRTLRGAIRREDAVARYGGEEFAILLPNTTLEEATTVAQNVREAISRAVVTHNGQQITVTASGGLAAIAPSERTETLIQRADAALYAAKAAGRDRTFVHDGAECRPADGYTQAAQLPAGPAAELVELIRAPDAHKQPENLPGDEVVEFGNYLPRETISAELAQTCDELRRVVVERSARQEIATVTTQS
jgi:diguanylate cyclase